MVTEFDENLWYKLVSYVTNLIMKKYIFRYKFGLIINSKLMFANLISLETADSYKMTFLHGNSILSVSKSRVITESFCYAKIAKRGIVMLQELNHAIDYIEEHLSDELSLEAISQHVGVSDYHFRTVFFYLAGMTLSEYVKNRRLSEANKDLLIGKKVTDVAYKYGYQSMDGFARAFKKWSGFLPSDVVKKRISKSFPKFSFIITVKGGISMEYRIVEKPAFYFAGVAGRVPMQFEGVNNAILELTMSITEEQKEKMHELQNMEPYQVVNVSYDADAGFLKEEGYLTQLIGVLTTKEDVSDCLEKMPVKACTWAIFPNEGAFPETLQNTMARIYSEWLPVSDYEIVNLPAFSFTKMDEHKKDYAYSEVWTPVRKK